jgi:MoxR-like ATPase
LTIETTKREVNGKTLDVQVLPTLTEEDINGRPVIAVVGRDKDWVNDDGETMPSYRVKFVKLWKDGKLLAPTTTNDLPF